MTQPYFTTQHYYRTVAPGYSEPGYSERQDCGWLVKLKFYVRKNTIPSCNVLSRIVKGKGMTPMVDPTSKYATCRERWKELYKRHLSTVGQSL